MRTYRPPLSWAGHARHIGACLLISGCSLAVFVERHDHYGCTETFHFQGLLEEFLLANLQRNNDLAMSSGTTFATETFRLIELTMHLP